MFLQRAMQEIYNILVLKTQISELSVCVIYIYVCNCIYI